MYVIIIYKKWIFITKSQPEKYISNVLIINIHFINFSELSFPQQLYSIPKLDTAQNNINNSPQN